MGKRRKIRVEGPINEQGDELIKMLREAHPDCHVDYVGSAKKQLEANQQENDLAFLGKSTDALREKRMEKFEDWFRLIVEHPMVLEYEKRDNGSYTFLLEDLGYVDLFPKANNLLVRKDNKWKKPALKWLIEKLGLER